MFIYCLEDRHALRRLDALANRAKPRDIGRRSDDGSIVLTSFGGTGTNSMEIVFDSANGIGSNSFVSAEGCQLLFFRSCRLIDRLIDCFIP